MQSFQEAMLGKFESICDSAKLTAIVIPEWTNTGIVLAQDRNNGGWRTVMKLHYDFQSTVSTVRLNGGTGPTDRENVFLFEPNDDDKINELFARWGQMCHAGARAVLIERAEVAEHEMVAEVQA